MTALFTANRIPHHSGLYHERIYYDNQVVAQILSDEHRGYWYVINGDKVSDGFDSVCAAKAALFPELDEMYG